MRTAVKAFKCIVITVLLVAIAMIVYLGFTETKHKDMFDTTYGCIFNNSIHFETENPDLKLNYIDFSNSITYKSVNAMGKDTDVHLFNGRKKLVDGEIIISKWLYLAMYCSFQEPFYISEAKYYSIVNDTSCLQRDMLLATTEDRSLLLMPDITYFSARSCLITSSLVRYNLLDLDDVKYEDYYLYFKDPSTRSREKSENSFTIAGYYVSPLDKQLETEVSHLKDYDTFIMYFAYEQIAYGYDNLLL
jgi:hypothetical protein